MLQDPSRGILFGLVALTGVVAAASSIAASRELIALSAEARSGAVGGEAITRGRAPRRLAIAVAALLLTALFGVPVAGALYAARYPEQSCSGAVLAGSGVDDPGEAVVAVEGEVRAVPLGLHCSVVLASGERSEVGPGWLVTAAAAAAALAAMTASAAAAGAAVAAPRPRAVAGAPQGERPSPVRVGAWTVRGGRRTR